MPLLLLLLLLLTMNQSISPHPLPTPRLLTAILLWKGADLNNKMQIILADGRTLAEHMNKQEASGERVPGQSDKPSYEKDAMALLGKDKNQNVLVCKEQILRWQKLMMSIESRQLIGSNSMGSSVSMSKIAASSASGDAEPGGEESQHLVADETASLTGAAGGASLFTVSEGP